MSLVFSGQPDLSVEQQLGEKLREVTTSFVGPETARNVRAGGDLARLFQPQTPEQTANQAQRLQQEKDLSSKLNLRDPRREKIEDIERASSLKFAQQENMLQERERLLRERQAENDERDFQNAWKSRQQAEALRAERAVNARAFILARKNGSLVPNSDHLQQAAEEISKEQGLNLDLLKSRIGLTQAQIPLAEARTKKAQRPPKAQRASLSDAAMVKAVEDFERVKQSLIDATSRGDVTMADALRRRLNVIATGLATKFGDRLEVGGGEWPYQKPRGSQGSVGQPQGPQGDNEISMAELQEIAKRKGITVEQARKMAESEGLTVR
jgi:hypothetical protein